MAFSSKLAFLRCFQEDEKVKKDKFQCRQLASINQQIIQIKMDQAKVETHINTLPHSFPSDRRGMSSQSSSILLPKIQDQQFYLCLTNTLLRLASEAGTPSEVLEQLKSSMLAARGLDGGRMLRDINQKKEDVEKRRESYNWLERQASSQEQISLLEKMQKELLLAREKQSCFHSLRKYMKDKEEEIAPVGTSSPLSRKERFKRMVKGRQAGRAIQSSNFYTFQVDQILQNSFKSENQCYRTISSFIHLKNMYGHYPITEDLQNTENYSQIYNAMYDRSENMVITGGEQGTIKVWHKNSGTLIKNLRGHTEYLNKIDTSKCNKYIISSGGDGIRIFDLRTLTPLGGWKSNSIAQIIFFVVGGITMFAFGDNTNLYFLTEDIMLARSHQKLQVKDFYVFNYRHMIDKDNSQVLVISLSPGKTHLVLALETGQFIFIKMEDLIQDLSCNNRGSTILLPDSTIVSNAHYDEIIEVKWSQNNNIFTTGSKDGRCCVWEYRNDVNKVHQMGVLFMNKGQKGRKKRSFACTYICWNCVYSHFAASFQQSVEEEDTDRGQGEVLVYSIKQNKVTCELSKDISLKLAGIKAMDAHPFYPNILLICEAQGHIILFDLFLGCIVNVFEERGYHISHPQFSLIPSQCRFAQDGLSFIVATEYGSVSLYGYDSKVFYSLSPTEQFLNNDFKLMAIESDSMKTISVNGDFIGDINDCPRGQILNLRGQQNKNAISINPLQLLNYYNSITSISTHNAQIKIDSVFLKKIEENLKDVAFLQQNYIKTYEQIQNAKQITLFHERERQYAIITSISTNKLKTLKNYQTEINVDIQEEEENQNQYGESEPIRKRKLKRHAQRTNNIRYADDFQYHSSQQQDYSVKDQIDPQQEIHEDIEQDYSQRDDQQVHMRRRDRNRNRRNTRQHSHQPKYQQEDIDEQVDERVLRRRVKRDNTNNYMIDEGEHYTRKRMKLDDEELENQQKKLNRLKKQVNNNGEMEEEEIINDCYRCQLFKSKIYCDNCQYTQQFCEECSHMRGRQTGDKFQCVICLFLDNQAPIEYEHVDEDFYRQTKRNSQLYVPQLDDEVRFFFQGYQQFLVQNILKLNNEIVKDNIAFRLLPHTQDGQLINTPLCKVQSIEYYYPSKAGLAGNSKRAPSKNERTSILMMIGLRQLEGETSSDIFWIYYLPGYEFLLLESVFSQIKQKDVVSKIKLFDLVQIKDQEIQIIQLSPFQDKYPQSLWKIVKVFKKTEGKRLRGNTKQIQRRMNIWKMSNQIDQQCFTVNLDEKHVQRLIRHLTKWIEEDSPYCAFIDYVEFQIYPIYRHQIAVGICLTTILKRLQNGYYNGLRSLQSDINRLYENSLKFNGSGHEITKLAKQLTDNLLTLQTEQHQVSNSKKSQQEDSNIKKQKKKEQIDECIDLSQMVYSQKRRTRNDQINNKKKKKDSSDYSEESSSREKIGVATRGGRTKPIQHEQEGKRMTRSRQRHV